ncbi:hypothetical protein [Gilliamella sp. Pas-s27]|uniref:Loki-CTERM sorting domain-containing protein n=1 Tax=Gilliamella sp. Pas-s27 TaxID=2687311 RepID=UPI00136613B1|nr:hypothetical protein [Gilliamella sp. Pas-s27]MWP47897.1 hypothetical protein [Gilliamella sp. Pas-s27]
MRVGTNSKKVVYFICFAGCFIPFFKEVLNELPGFSLILLLCLGFVSIVLFIIIIQNNQMYNCEDEQNTKRLNNKEHNKKHRRAIKKQERKRIKNLKRTQINNLIIKFKWLLI